jgi:hypothetical protein
MPPRLHTHTQLELRLRPLLHTSYIGTVNQSHYVEMSSQGVVSSKDGTNAGLYSVKEQ